MSIVALLIAVVVVGLIAWLITLIPMPEVFKKIIWGVLIFFLVIFVLQQLGVSTGLPTISLK